MARSNATAVAVSTSADLFPPPAPPDLDDEAYLAQAEGEIRGYGRLVVSGIVAIGKKLVEVKERVGHGRYEKFIRERLRFSPQAAHNYVQSYELLKSLTVGDLKSLQIDARSLYLLARPTTPEEVRAEALEKAASPDGISRDEVAALVEQARQQAAAKATAEAQQQSVAQLAKAAKETQAEIAKLTKAEARSTELATKLAELRASRSEELAKARAEAARQFEGKLILTEDELHEQISRLMKPSDRRIAQLEKQLETANARREQTQLEIKRLRERLNSDAPKQKPFDSNLSLKALSVEQAIEHLRSELKLSPAECIAIEMEMATRIHQRPALANEKLSRMAASIADIMPWFEKFLELQSAGAQQ
jgi:DNA repair exonuclease SbcCD ATPase subunit